MKALRALVLLFVLAGSSSLASESKIEIVADNYPPYYGQDLPKGGVLTEIVVEAFGRAGYAVELKFAPWKRALEGAKTGKYEGIFTLWYRAEREEWFAYSELEHGSGRAGGPCRHEAVDGVREAVQAGPRAVPGVPRLRRDQRMCRPG